MRGSLENFKSWRKTMSGIGISGGGNNVNHINNKVSSGPEIKKSLNEEKPIPAEPAPIQKEPTKGEAVQRRNILDRIQNLDVSVLDPNRESSSKTNEAEQSFNNWDTFNNWHK